MGLSKDYQPVILSKKGLKGVRFIQFGNLWMIIQNITELFGFLQVPLYFADLNIKVS